MRLAEEFTHTIEIEKSRFICILSRVFSEAEAREKIQKIRKEMPDATHHCTAFVIGENNELARSNDDGEPSGTAGVPMLEALKRSGLHDTLAVVVRYFGGIKLGAGGLVRAYSRSVSEAVSLAKKTKTMKMHHYVLTIPYSLLGKLEYTLKSCDMVNKEYGEQVSLEFYAESKEIETVISECTSGKHLPVHLEETVVERVIAND